MGTSFEWFYFVKTMNYTLASCVDVRCRATVFRANHRHFYYQFISTIKLCKEKTHRDILRDHSSGGSSNCGHCYTGSVRHLAFHSRHNLPCVIIIIYIDDSERTVIALTWRDVSSSACFDLVCSPSVTPIDK